MSDTIWVCPPMLITPSTIPALAGDVQQLGWITELALRQRAIDQR
ncbi:MAG TPA: hypothetical protein VFW54_05845 [Propionibacteriaceae bacterium]|nr:hypothetical protein [Propionibacteriaceae bacterium]